MIQSEPKSKSVSYGVSERKAFTIRPNAKSFKVLIANIYSNQVSAIISELGQNSYDSHVAAKNKNPFDVKLPTSFDPVFEVRDYGIGMKNSFVMNEYLEVFNSTKDNSNEFSGAWGIGRISALGISNEYTLSCYTGKTVNLYSININHGCPEAHFIRTQDSDEPRGVRITIPVPNQYIRQFHEEAKSVFKFYPIQPKIKDNVVVLEKPEYEQCYKNAKGEIVWGVLKGQSAPTTVMGLYTYNIDPSNFSDCDDVAIRNIVRLPVLLNFQIGELDVSANRQSLSYTKKTKDAIIDRLKVVKKSFKDKIDKEFSSITSYFEGCKKLRELQSDPASNKICNILGINNNYKINGRQIRNHFSFDINENRDFNVRFNEYSNKSRYYGDKLKNFKLQNASLSHSFGEDELILINDMSYGDKGIDKVIITCNYIHENNQNIKHIDILTFKNNQEKERLIKEYGLENLELYSHYYELAKKHHKTVSGSSKKYSKCLKPDQYGKLREHSIDLENDSFVYIPVKQGQSLSKYYKTGYRERLQLNNRINLNQEIYEKFNIIFLKGDDKKCRKNKKAVHFDKLIDDVKKEIGKHNQYRIKKEIARFLNSYDQNVLRVFKFLLTEKQKSLFDYPKDSDFDNNDLIHTFLKTDLKYLFDLKYVSQAKLKKVTGLIKKELFNNYPILRYVNPNLVDENFKKTIVDWKVKKL